MKTCVDTTLLSPCQTNYYGRLRGNRLQLTCFDWLGERKTETSCFCNDETVSLYLMTITAVCRISIMRNAFLRSDMLLIRPFITRSESLTEEQTLNARGSELGWGSNQIYIYMQVNVLYCVCKVNTRWFICTMFLY